MKKALTVLLGLILTLTLFTACGDEAMEYEKDREKYNNMLAGITESENKNDEEDFNYDEYDLVIAYFGVPELEDLITKWTESTGANVKVIWYYKDEDYKELDIKLMAEDKDIDIYCTVNLDIYKYLNHEYYVDLSEFESLKTRLESNKYTKFAAEHNGEYFGIPFLSRYDDKMLYINNSPKFLDYRFKTVDVVEGTYTDPEGEKLYEIFRYAYDHDHDFVPDPMLELDFIVSKDQYLIMSPYSQHREMAVKFLEAAYDYRESGDGLYNGIYKYPDVGDEDMSNVYQYYKSIVPSITAPIADAFYDELMETDGSDEALRKLAKEAAEGVMMRLNE